MGNEFGNDTEEIEGKKWNWDEFKTTENFPISKQLLLWVIGQDKAIRECRLCIDEWIAKLKWLNRKKWWESFENPTGYKSHPKEMLPAGPFIFLVGSVGTGKSLIGRAMQNYMTELYKKHGIILHDVVSWKNPKLPSEPKITIHATPMGRNVITDENAKTHKKTWFSRWGLKLFSGFMVSVGAILFGIALYSTWQFISTGIPFPIALSQNSYLLVAGGGLMFSGIFIGIIGKMMGNFGGNTQQGIGGASTSQGPKLLVDNSSGQAPFLDATGHTSAQLFGDITWDPYQSGGLGTPEHQRVNAGDVHRAHLGILFIDEIKNLTGPEAITLLTVLEDGQMVITHRGHHGETGAMMVSTEPVPAMVFLIAAGNLDSVPQVHPALMDRIQGYGKVVYMNDDMLNTVANRRKYIQFISQEIKRFNLLPFTREACLEIIAEARRKSGLKERLTCKFRPMISVIKTASTLASNDGKMVVDVCYVKEAINEHCKSVYQQVLEHQVEMESLYKVVNPNDEPKIGQVYGMAVGSDEGASSEMVGCVFPIKASMIKKRKDLKESGYFTVTGVNATEGSWVQNSIAKVRHLFMQMYKKDLAIDFKTHIDFAQELGIDGPSAGVAMTLVLISTFTKRKLRQDVAVTGEINIGIEGKVLITPIGGTHQKILAAEKRGFKVVCIPRKNYENDIVPSEYNIKIVPCDTIDDYTRECFANSDSE